MKNFKTNLVSLHSHKLKTHFSTNSKQRLNKTKVLKFKDKVYIRTRASIDAKRNFECLYSKGTVRAAKYKNTHLRVVFKAEEQ